MVTRTAGGDFSHRELQRLGRACKEDARCDRRAIESRLYPSFVDPCVGRLRFNRSIRLPPPPWKHPWKLRLPLHLTGPLDLSNVSPAGCPCRSTEDRQRLLGINKRRRRLSQKLAMTGQRITRRIIDDPRRDRVEVDVGEERRDDRTTTRLPRSLTMSTPLSPPPLFPRKQATDREYRCVNLARLRLRK